MAVVRCPVCRGASRVGADLLGHRVRCPRCPVTFVAAEEVASERPPAPETVRPVKVIPIAPPRRPDAPPTAEPAPAAPTDPVHDPHSPAAGRLPATVLIGLALVPFGIPLLWVVAPLVTGQGPAMSLAVPVALAVAAAVLCFGVVYTIDWTPATRVKGVLMLVALSYLTAAGLYFLKRDLIEALQNVLSPKARWTLYTSESGSFRVQMPAKPEVHDEQPLLNVPTAGGRRARFETATGETFTFVATASPPDKPQAGFTDEWYKMIGAHLAKSGRPVEERAVTEGELTGREWRLELGDENFRAVRVYVRKGRVFYLAVDGPHLELTDEFAVRFFRSLEPLDTKPGAR
ncbi:MAG: hypothetical protein FJ304_09875 [Planctomycetes bacterium]|nr:hypothetical protein [Planctomycetota bacterium]